MARDRKTNALIRRIQANEKVECDNRLYLIQRALQKHGKKLAEYELTNLEAALRPAIGRIAIEAR